MCRICAGVSSRPPVSSRSHPSVWSFCIPTMATTGASGDIPPPAPPLPPPNANGHYPKAVWKDRDINMLLDQAEKHKAKSGDGHNFTKATWKKISPWVDSVREAGGEKSWMSCKSKCTIYCFSSFPSSDWYSSARPWSSLSCSSVEEQVELQASPGPMNTGPISRLLIKQPGRDSRRYVDHNVCIFLCTYPFPDPP